MSIMRKTLVTLAVGGASLLTGCATGQPSPGCYVQDGNFAVRYIEVSRSGTCTPTTTTLGQARPAETFGVFKYRDIEDESSGGKLAFRPLRAANVAAAAGEMAGGYAQNTSATGLGNLAAEPTGEGTEQYCNVSDVTPVSVTAAGVTTQYTFENMRMYNGPRALGTQFNGRVTFRQTGPSGTCEIVSDVRGTWPNQYCDTALPEQQPENPETAEEIDAAAHSCGVGSFLSLDVQYECVADPAAAGAGLDGRCVAAKPTPSYKDGIEELEYTVE